MIDETTIELPIKISVIVPAYNVEDYIDEAIESLLKQTRPFHEIIVVNDGSTDSTGDVLNKYVEARQIILLEQNNRGLGSARNTGLQQACGDFVYFFDSDDVLEATFVDRMQRLIAEDAEVDLIFFSGESFFIGDSRPDFYPAYRRRFNTRFSDGLEALDMMQASSVMFASACMYLSRRAVWEEYSLNFMLIIHEDEEILLRLCASARTTRVVDEVYFRRRIRAGSIMTSASLRNRASGLFSAYKSNIKYCKMNNDRLRCYYNVVRTRLVCVGSQYVAVATLAGDRIEATQVLVDFFHLGLRPPIKLLYKAAIANFLWLWSKVIGRYSRHE